MKVSDIKVGHVYKNAAGARAIVKKINYEHQVVAYNDKQQCFLPLFADISVEDIGEVEQ